MTKTEIKNKAIAEDDCILLEGETVVPIELTNNAKLFYYDSDMKPFTCNINNVTIEGCK